MTWSLDTPIAIYAGDDARTRAGWHDWHAILDQVQAPGLLSGRQQDLLQKATNRSGVRSLLSGVFGHSPYLTSLLLRRPGLLADIIADGFDHTAQSLLHLTKSLKKPAQTDRAARLRHLKSDIALVVALADLAGAWDLGQVTTCLSQFAELSVQIALIDCLQRQIQAGRLRSGTSSALLNHCGIFILGMGKLGAHELNYSSDIDLIILYDPARLMLTDDLDARDAMTRISRDLVAFLDQRTGDGYVFRTDLRLRPDPASTPLAVDTIHAARYYQSTARSWERAAMLKARMVAGDPHAAAPFMTAIKRWVWRGKMDFTTLADIGNVKQRIDAHHLTGTGSLAGYNVKLGFGGIREIEFYTQAQQLIFGAHHAPLRHPATLKALHALSGAGHTPPRLADMLADAYKFWRQTEHRLQMIDDQQTHSLPDNDAGIDALAAFMGLPPEQFRNRIHACQMTVGTAFGTLFGQLCQPESEDTEVQIDDLHLAEKGFNDPDRARRIIEAWLSGQTRATRHQRAQSLLRILLPDLLNSLCGYGQPDQALLLFDRFIESLPAGVEMLSLFQARSDLRDMMGMILSLSPALADMITRQPRVLEAVLAPDFLAPLPDRAALEKSLYQRLILAEHYEDALDLCRRWVHERQFQGGVHCLTGYATPDQGGIFFSQIAETALANLFPRVHQEFARRHGHVEGGAMAILAMGNLASGDLTISSDIDLVLVYQNPPDAGPSNGARPLGPNEYWLKLAERLVTAITAPTAAGRLFELDLRLRPLGDSGPLAISLEGFIRYQREQAWTWEHMALIRARPIMGPPALCDRIQHIIHHTLTQPRDPQKLRHDIADMRARIDQQFGHNFTWRLKYRRGGLVDTQFIAAYLLLRHGHSFGHIMTINTEQAFRHLADIDALDAHQAQILCSANRIARQLRFMIRMVTAPNVQFDPSTAAPEILHTMAHICDVDTDREGLDFSMVEHKLSHILLQAHQIFTALMEPT